MLTYSVKRIGQAPRGRRIWMEGRRLERSGFVPQRRYTVEIDRSTSTMTLRLAPDGDRMVSRKQRDGRTYPLLDITNGSHLAMFEGMECVRVVYEADRIVISPLVAETRRLARLERLRDRLRNGEPLSVGSVSTGVGVLSLAIHDGLTQAGLENRAAFVCDLDEGYLDQCEAANPVFDRDTVVVSAPMQTIAYDPVAMAALPRIDVLEAGIPCTAHSSAGRAKKGLTMPEEDPNVGHLATAFLAIVAALNPAVVLVENVPNYIGSASYHILRTQLTEWGYDVHHDVLRGVDFDSFESRDRMALIAVTKGIGFDVNDIERREPTGRTLSEILETVPEDDARWTPMTYLREKEERDMADGKGFRMQIFDGESTSVSTIGRGYAKVRSTEPKIRHPTDPDLLRQLTPVEHARCKGIPEAIVEGMTITRAHEVLGQSVLYEPFRETGRAIGAAMRSWAGRPDDVPEFRLVA